MSQWEKGARRGSTIVMREWGKKGNCPFCHLENGLCSVFFYIVLPLILQVCLPKRELIFTARCKASNSLRKISTFLVEVRGLRENY